MQNHRVTELVEVSKEPEAPKPKLVRRHSAGGMALHRWQEAGKASVIQVVMELSGDGVSAETLTALVTERLLKRFPRFRGHVSESARHWVVPETVDARLYVSDVQLEGADHRAAVVALLEAEYRKPLPSQCSWEVRRVTCAGRVSLFWRIAHTAADGIILTQLLSHVLCDSPATGDAPPQAAATSPAAGTISSTTSSGADDAPQRRTHVRAGCLERVWAFVKGLLFVSVLLLWPSDRRSAISLGPSKWKRRLRRQRQGTSKDEGVAMALSRPVAVAKLKAAARNHGATINDLLLASLGAGLHAYLAQEAAAAEAGDEKKKTAALAQLERLSLTASVVVNPRQHHFALSASDAEDLLGGYASMSTYGCDITIGLLSLPCGGAVAPNARLAAVRRSMRHMKLSPEVLLTRRLIMVLNSLCGVAAVTSVMELVVAKTSMYVSNVLGPAQPSNFGGVPIEALYFGVAPFDYGVGFSFFSYNGELTLCCCSDKETVPVPQAVVDHVRDAMVKYCAEQEAV